MRHHWFRRTFTREKSLRSEEMMMMIIIIIIIIIIGFTNILQNINKTKREYYTTKRK